MSQNARAKLVKLTLLIVISMAIQVFATSVTASGNGKWLPVNDSECPSTGGLTGCPSGNTCSEWDVDGEGIMTCCIASQDVGSDDIYACPTY